VHRAKTVADILGTRHTQHRRNGLEDTDCTLCRLCGDELETDSHVLWECKHSAVGQARRALSKEVRSAWRESGLGLDGLAVVHALWGLDDSDAVRCKTTRDLRRTLGCDMTQQAAKLEAAMLGHTLDVTGMYSDRLGLFGNGWLVLLEDLGLQRAQALNALVAVARVLQGTHGTLAIWKAFTSTLDTQDRTAVCSVKSQLRTAHGFEEWAAEMRQRLREEGVEDDEPFRVLAAASATGMANKDMDDFACLVQGWVEGTMENDSTAEDLRCWAKDTAEAIEMAGATIAADRNKRGCRKIAARDRARADAKAKATDRKRGLLESGKPEWANAAGRETLRKAIAKLTGGRQTRIAVTGNRSIPTGPPSDRRKQRAVQTGTTGGATRTDTTVTTSNDTWQNAARAARAEDRSRRNRGLAGEVLRDNCSVRCKRRATEDTNRQAGDSPAKRTKTSRRDKRKGDEADLDNAQAAARANLRNTRLTGTTRARSMSDDDSSCTDRARRARTREQASMGTTNLEPD
jgi:hypothetical protein